MLAFSYEKQLECLFERPKRHTVAMIICPKMSFGECIIPLVHESFRDKKIMLVVSGRHKKKLSSIIDLGLKQLKFLSILSNGASWASPR